MPTEAAIAETDRARLLAELKARIAAPETSDARGGRYFVQPAAAW